VWPSRSVARNRYVDEPRIDLLQVLVAEAVLLRRTRAEILAEDVGAGDKFVEDLSPFRCLEVEGDALDTTVVGLEKRAGMTGKNGRDARAAPAIGGLDLDDLCAKVGHQHVGPRARLRRGAGNDPDAPQRANRFGHGSCLLLSTLSRGV